MTNQTKHTLTFAEVAKEVTVNVPPPKIVKPSRFSTYCQQHLPFIKEDERIEKNALEQQVAELELVIENTKSEFDDLLKEIEQLNRENMELKVKLLTREGENDQLSLEVDSLLEQSTRYVEKIEELEEQIEKTLRGTPTEHLIMNSVSELPQEDNPEDPNDKSKEKGAKPKKPKPGQVRIERGLDGTTLFCCPECHTSYPEKELLEQHLVDHKIEKRFICDICGECFKRKSHVVRHISCHNPERPFVCSVCKKDFKLKEHLDQHFLIHAPEKTHICEECGKGFTRKDHLRDHTRSHITRRDQAERAQAGGAPEDVQNELDTPTVTNFLCCMVKL